MATAKSKPKTKPKTTKVVTPKSAATRVRHARTSKRQAPTPRLAKAPPAAQGSKQDAILVLLRAPKGTDISAMMKATGWQAHSVRGFLAGTVKSKLKLNLISEKLDGRRLYRIAKVTGER